MPLNKETKPNQTKSFTALSSLVSLTAWLKLALSHFVWEILNIFMHYLSDDKLRHSYISGYWFAGIMAWISPTNSGIVFLSEQSDWDIRVAACLQSPLGSLKLFWNPSHCPQTDTITPWNETSSMNANQYSILFSNRSELYHCFT